MFRYLGNRSAVALTRDREMRRILGHAKLWILILCCFISSSCTYPRSPAHIANTPTLIVPQPTSTAHLLTIPTASAPHSVGVTATLLPTPIPLSTTLPTPTASSNFVAFIQESQTSPKTVSLWTLDLGNGSLQQLLSPQPASSKGVTTVVSWSQNKRWLGAALGSTLWVFPRDGTSGFEVKLDSSKGHPVHIVWSPDSTQLGFVQQSDLSETAYIGIVNLRTQRMHYLYPEHDGQGFIMQMTWSPDGRYLAFVRQTFNVMLLRLADLQLTLLGSDCGAVVTQLAWSPDSRWIAQVAFGNGHYGYSAICISSLDGQTIAPSVEKSYTGNPAWDDSSTILYFAADSLDELANSNAVILAPNPRLLSFDIHQRHTVQLTPLREGPANAPFLTLAYSPDGQTLSYLSNKTDPTLTIVRRDGTILFEESLRVLLPNTRTSPYLAHHWSYDGRSLFICRTETDGWGNWSSQIYQFDIQSGSMTQVLSTTEIIDWSLAP